MAETVMDQFSGWCREMLRNEVLRLRSELAAARKEAAFQIEARRAAEQAVANHVAALAAATKRAEEAELYLHQYAFGLAHHPECQGEPTYRCCRCERDALAAKLATVADEAEQERRTAEAAVKFLGRIGEVTWEAGFPSGDREQTLKNVRALASRLAEARDAAEAYLVGGNPRPLARWFREVPK